MEQVEMNKLVPLYRDRTLYNINHWAVETDYQHTGPSDSVKPSTSGVYLEQCQC